MKLNTRKDFTKLIDNNNYKIGVEIGVADGLFTKYILNNSKNIIMTMIDPFTANNRDYKCPVQSTFQNNIKYIPDRCHIIVTTSKNALQYFNDESIDFIYIDGLHEDIAFDIEKWFPKLKKGGCFSGHDYHQGFQIEVYNAVNNFQKQTNLELHLTGADNKLDDGMEQNVPSWFFIK